MKTLIEMAHEVYGEHTFWTEDQLLKLKAFAELVRADQREIDAKVCDDGYDTFFENNGVEHNRKRYDQQAVERAIRAGVEFVTADCAAAIRARGNT